MKCERAFVGDGDCAVAIAAKETDRECLHVIFSPQHHSLLLRRGLPARGRRSGDCASRSCLRGRHGSPELGRGNFACNWMDRNESSPGSQVALEARLLQLTWSDERLTTG